MSSVHMTATLGQSAYSLSPPKYPEVCLWIKLRRYHIREFWWNESDVHIAGARVQIKADNAKY